MSAFSLLVVKLAAGLLADRLFGEPRRLHPLIGFGHWAKAVEAATRRLGAGRGCGLLAWLAAVGPGAGLARSRARDGGVADAIDAGAAGVAISFGEVTHARAKSTSAC